MIRAVVMILSVLLPVAAHAQSLRLKNYLHPESDGIRALNETYLAGALDALTAYNMAAPVKLFCKTDGPVAHQEAARLISDWANKQTKMEDDTIVVIPLLHLLKRTYPCR